MEPSTKDITKLKASLPQKRKTHAIGIERKKLKSVELNQESVTVDRALSSEVEVVLVTHAPTPTLTIDSREGIVKRS